MGVLDQNPTRWSSAGWWVAPTDTICIWDHLQTGPSANEAMCTRDRLQMGPSANETICKRDCTRKSDRSQMGLSADYPLVPLVSLASVLQLSVRTPYSRTVPISFHIYTVVGTLSCSLYEKFKPATYCGLLKNENIHRRAGLLVFINGITIAIAFPRLGRFQSNSISGELYVPRGP